MDIAEFLTETTKALIPVATLTTLAADRRAFGQDVCDAFTSQIQQRSTQAQTVLDSASAAGRDTLLASEQRSYDGAMRERDSILSLLAAVERRTEARGFVPESQRTIEPRTERAELSQVLTKEQRCAEFLTRRGHARYQGERGSDSMRFGSVVRALALGDRRGLSDLELRALSEGSDAAGGFTVPEILGAQFIDRVRNSMVVMRAGAQTVPMTTDTLHLARLAQPGAFTAGSPTGSAANWKAENDAITEASLALERVSFVAKTLPMLIKLSVELSEDSANIDQIIERELSQAMALELDRAALFGTGTAPEPKGVINQTNVSVTSQAGATPTSYDFLINGIGTVWGQNFTPTARLYNAQLATAIAKFKGAVDLQPLLVPVAIDEVPELRTNQIPSEGSPTTTTAFIGDFTQLMVGVRTSFRLEISRQAADAVSSAFGNLQVWVRAYLRADVQLAHPEAFAVLTDIGV